jgi:hypothetical protein
MKPHIKKIQIHANDYLSLHVECVECHRTILILCTADEWDAYKHGLLIQDAFPNMSADEREMIISGICPKCWDVMFKEDDDIGY